MTVKSSTQRPNRKNRRTILASAVLVAAVAIAVFALTSNGADSDSDTAADQPPAVVTEPSRTPQVDDRALVRREKADALAIGRADAPVVMIEYSDFQCPFCGKFARETKPELLRSYVDKGLLRIEWRNFPVFGEESEQAALAGWAAGEQNKFWELHDVAFSKPRDRNAGEFSEEKLADMARSAGIKDIGRFRADMTSDAARKAVQRDQEEGYGLGVTSTPAFLVNGSPILGAQPTDTFKKAIDAAVKAAGQ